MFRLLDQYFLAMLDPYNQIIRLRLKIFGHQLTNRFALLQCLQSADYRIAITLQPIEMAI